MYCITNKIELTSQICALRKMCTFLLAGFCCLANCCTNSQAGVVLSALLLFSGSNQRFKDKVVSTSYLALQPLIILIPSLPSSLIHLIHPTFSYPSYPPVSNPPGKAGAGTSKDLKSANVAFFVHFIFFLRRMKTKQGQ